MEDEYVRMVLWAFIIISGVAIFWYHGRKRN
jgi:hypothetical protein